MSYLVPIMGTVYVIVAFGIIIYTTTCLQNPRDRLTLTTW